MNSNKIDDARANTKTKRDRLLEAMPKNYVDQSRLCVIAIETFIREIVKLSATFTFSLPSISKQYRQQNMMMTSTALNETDQLQ
jgi:hypothetical protein